MCKYVHITGTAGGGGTSTGWCNSGSVQYARDSRGIGGTNGRRQRSEGNRDDENGEIVKVFVSVDVGVQAALEPDECWHTVGVDMRCGCVCMRGRYEEMDANGDEMR